MMAGQERLPPRPSLPWMVPANQGSKRCLTNIVDLSFSFPSAEMEGWFLVLDVLGAVPKVRTR